MVSFAATAATCTPASTNDYFYTTPKTTNIFGRVMSETGDYRLVRQEDIAWINEAWAERMALADGLGSNTNALHGATLVKGGSNHTFGNSDWWTDGALSTVATNAEGLGFAEMASLASGGTMTNLSLQSGGPTQYGLVKMAWLTNEFAKLKQMRRLVVSPGLITNTVDYITREHTAGHVVESWELMTPPYDYETNSVATNAENVLEIDVYAEGTNNKQGQYYHGHDEPWDYSEYRHLERYGPEGLAVAPLRISVDSTNAWLRGASSPRVVGSARVWGLAHVMYHNRELEVSLRRENGLTYEDTIKDTYLLTNATVLVDLGAPRWVRAEEGILVCEATLEPAAILANCLNVVGWMPALSEITEASLPTQPSNGRSYYKKSITGSLSLCLVFDMKPISWVDGW